MRRHLTNTANQKRLMAERKSFDEPPVVYAASSIKPTGSILLGIQVETIVCGGRG